MWELNMREEEYNKMQKKLADYHEDELESLNAVISDLERLLGNDKDFHLQQTGNNLLALLNVIKQDILPLIDSTFQATEQYVDTIITSFNNIDTLC